MSSWVRIGLLAILIILSTSSYGFYKEMYSFKPLLPAQVALVTYYAPKVDPNQRIHISADTYETIVNGTLTNMAAYSHRQGMPFFYRNKFLVEGQEVSPYWSKMKVVQHYLDAGFEWVIWSDVDILFTNHRRSLVTEWIGPAHQKHHVAFVLECVNNSPQEYSTVRSGFIAFRNSPEAREFLQHWRLLHAKFEKNWNPDQEALEEMVQEPKWKQMAYIVPPDGIHTYPKCYEKYDRSAISVHFPAGDKSMIAGFEQKIKLKRDDFEILYPSR